MTELDFEYMRNAMVSNQLRTNAVTDPHVLAAAAAVARENHVAPEQKATAYIDRAIPLGNGRALNPPLATARLLSEAHPVPGERVLVIGAASGYAAALLAHAGLEVTALEQDAALLAQARAAVAAPNVRFVEGPLEAGWSADAPYDLVLIDGAVEEIPHGIIDQVADGGRIAAAIVDRGVTRLAIGRKAGRGFGLTLYVDAEAVALPGFARPRTFAF